METPAIPIALVDDHTLFRSMMAEMLEGIPQYRVVLEASHGVEYMRAIKNGTEISVAVVDLHMPLMDGYETIAWIRANTPGTRALALTFEGSEEAQERALRAGACGFLRKDVGKNVFKDALDQVATLGHYHNDTPQEPADPLVAPTTRYERSRAEVHAQLTDREVEFVHLICDEAEYTYDEVAKRMQIHRRTVDGFRESVFEKFNLKSKAGLVIFAFKWGLITHQEGTVRG